MSDIDFKYLEGSTVPLCNQDQIAGLLGVDRTTIRNYTKRGLPYIAPESKGARAWYPVPVAVHWLGAIGCLKTINEKRRINLEDLDDGVFVTSIGMLLDRPGGDKFEPHSRDYECFRVLNIGKDVFSKKWFRAGGVVAGWRAAGLLAFDKRNGKL